MRLKQRSSVLLPQQDGPISAVTLFRAIGRVMCFRALKAPYQKERSWTWALGSGVGCSALGCSGVAGASDRSCGGWFVIGDCVIGDCVLGAGCWGTSRTTGAVGLAAG